MAEEQTKDSELRPVIQYACKGDKLKILAISKISTKYLLQCNCLVLKQGVLHEFCIPNGVESHQLVLPLVYHQAMLEMWQDGYGHQELDCMVIVTTN